MPREEKLGSTLAEIVTSAIKDSYPRTEGERATAEDIAALRTRVVTLLSQVGRRYPVANDTYGHIIQDVPKELIPNDTLDFLHPGKPVHMEFITDYSGGETSIIFRQTFNVNSLSALSVNTVTYNLSGAGNRIVQQATSAFAQPYERALNPKQPDQHSFLSRKAVTQLTNTFNHPQLQPKPSQRRS